LWIVRRISCGRIGGWIVIETIRLLLEILLLRLEIRRHERECVSWVVLCGRRRPLLLKLKLLLSVHPLLRVPTSRWSLLIGVVSSSIVVSVPLFMLHVGYQIIDHANGGRILSSIISFIVICSLSVERRGVRYKARK